MKTKSFLEAYQKVNKRCICYFEKWIAKQRESGAIKSYYGTYYYIGFYLYYKDCEPCEPLVTILYQIGVPKHLMKLEVKFEEVK